LAANIGTASGSVHEVGDAEVATSERL